MRQKEALVFRLSEVGGGALGAKSGHWKKRIALQVRGWETSVTCKRNAGH